MLNRCNINISPNKVSKIATAISLDQKIITLIGENGSGKSAILEKIFQSHFTDEDKSIIVFSSGLNESFSQIVKKYVNKAQRLNFKSYQEYIDQDEQEKFFIKSFYFDKRRGGLLIFLANYMKKGKVRERFLLEENTYLNTGDFPLLSLKISIKQSYLNLLSQSTGMFKSLETSFFHNQLDDFINNSYIANTGKDVNGDFYLKINEKVDYSFDAPFKKTLVIKGDSIAKAFPSSSEKLLTFLGFLYKHFTNLVGVNVHFSNGIQMNDISDGQYQLLVVYAILDLFDSDNTLFLFDEIDSHLHFLNINKLWSCLSKTKGNVIVTTHIPDSIVSNSFPSIKLVKDGIVDDLYKANAIVNRLNTLSHADFYAKKYASRLTNIILVEDETDWFIFSELIMIKLGLPALKLLNEKVEFIKCASGYGSHNEEFAKNKKDWVGNFDRVNGRDIETKNIFFVCDRDNLPLSSINSKNKVQVDGEKIKFGQNSKAFVLAWRRREIENYLLSYTMLANNSILNTIQKKLPAADKLKKKNSCDNSSVQNVEIKDIIKKLYCNDGSGVDYEKLKKIVNQIPPNEISDDIINMYEFITSKI